MAVATCVMVNMLDGFDVFVMAFAAHSISTEWSLDGKSLGILFSAGYTGMAIGAMFLSRLADNYGRRRLVIFCLGLITLGMFVSALSTGFYMLVIVRVFTGLGIGASLASLNCIAAEYSSDKYRGLCLSILQIGYPVGAVIGGAAAAFLISEMGWRSIFFLGALLSLVMIPVVMWRLPESLDYLLARRPGDALDRINALLARMGHSIIDVLPGRDIEATELKAGVRTLWAPEYRRATILLWLGFFMVMSGVYFVFSWTPKLLIHAGLSENEGISGGMILQIGGIIGQALFGFLCITLRAKLLSVVYMFFSAVLMCIFAFYSSNLTVAMYLGAGVGFFLFGSINGLYVLSPSLYPAQIRTTGIGWGIGVGRFGAIIAPFLTGVLLDMGWETSRLYLVFAVPMLVAMAAILFISIESGDGIQNSS